MKACSSPLLRHLTPVRNFCAHHERLWDRDLKTKMKIPRNMGMFSKPASLFNLNQIRKALQHACNGRLLNQEHHPK